MFDLIFFSALAGADKCGEKPGYIYDAATDQRSEVYNVRGYWFSLQPRGAATIDGRSEFAAAYEDCSNSATICLSGPTSIVLPRPIREGISRNDTAECRTSRTVIGFRADCSTLNGAMRIVYDLSLSRGLVQYSRLKSERWETYHLRGFCGLFSGRVRDAAPEREKFR